MISAISSRGQMKFMMVRWKINGDIFIDFLKLLVETKKSVKNVEN